MDILPDISRRESGFFVSARIVEIKDYYIAIKRQKKDIYKQCVAIANVIIEHNRNVFYDNGLLVLLSKW